MAAGPAPAINPVTHPATGPAAPRPPLPMPLALIALALLAGLAAGLDSGQLLQRFGAGFGRPLGDFVLILLPAFTLAACLGELALGGGLGRGTVAGAPLLAAGMACPDTAYAALAPAAGASRLAMAFAGYGGFKLLVPAGPLVVAAGLGLADPPGLLPIGLALALPVVGVGVWWACWRAGAGPRQAPAAAPDGATLQRATLPLAAMLLLLGLGAGLPRPAPPLLVLLTSPKGALIVAAALALALTAPGRRGACLDAALRRSAPLLLLIGAASALAAMLEPGFNPVGWIVSLPGPLAQAAAVFATAALVKTVQGSSMATFAALGPLLAPLVAAGALPAPALVFAICLGSLALILPNDSYYHLLRADALAQEGERRALVTLAGGSALQALAGLGALGAALALGWL